MPRTPTIASGKFRHRIAIQSYAGTRTANGGVTRTFSTDETRWGMIESLSAKEFIASNQTDARITHKITMRFVSGLTEEKRLTHAGRIFNIISVLNVSERDRRTIVMALEDTTNPGT